MPRQHRLWWVAPIGIFLALGIIVHWAAEQVGWIYTGAIFGFILVGILLWVGRTAIAQPLEKLFSLKVPQTALLFLWVTAILVLAVVTMGIVEDFVAGKLALNETGKIFFRILYPLAVAVVFFPYKQVTGVEPGLVLRGAGLLASIFLIAYLITQFSEARKTAALSLSSPAAPGGETTPQPIILPDGSIHLPPDTGFILEPGSERKFMFGPLGVVFLRGRYTYLCDPVCTERDGSVSKEVLQDVASWSARFGDNPCWTDTNSFYPVIRAETSVHLKARSPNDPACVR